MIVMVVPKKTAIWIEETPGGFKRHELEAGGVALLPVRERNGSGQRAAIPEESDMAKAAKKADAKTKSKDAKAKAEGKKEKAKTGPKGPRGDIVGKKIKLLVKENPRRPGTRAHEIYKKYKDGMTVDAFIKAGGTVGDLNWDKERDHIDLV